HRRRQGVAGGRRRRAAAGPLGPAAGRPVTGTVSRGAGLAGMDSRRAESFSDGVFSVAITLLVIDLLSIGHGDLTYNALGRAWPQYAAYVVSFLTIGIMWLNHHTM